MKLFSSLPPLPSPTHTPLVNATQLLNNSIRAKKTRVQREIRERTRGQLHRNNLSFNCNNEHSQIYTFFKRSQWSFSRQYQCLPEPVAGSTECSTHRGGLVTCRLTHTQPSWHSISHSGDLTDAKHSRNNNEQ